MLQRLPKGTDFMAPAASATAGTRSQLARATGNSNISLAQEIRNLQNFSVYPRLITYLLRLLSIKPQNANHRARRLISCFLHCLATSVEPALSPSSKLIPPANAKAVYSPRLKTGRAFTILINIRIFEL